MLSSGRGERVEGTLDEVNGARTFFRLKTCVSFKDLVIYIRRLKFGSVKWKYLREALSQHPFEQWEN